MLVQQSAGHTIAGRRDCGPFSFANTLAIDPSGEWLYVVPSTAPNVVRAPLDCPDRPLETVSELPTGHVPDGIAFASDGRLLMACYKPDVVLLGALQGHVVVSGPPSPAERTDLTSLVAAADANIADWAVTLLGRAGKGRPGRFRPFRSGPPTAPRRTFHAAQNGPSIGSR